MKLKPTLLLTLALGSVAGLFAQQPSNPQIYGPVELPKTLIVDSTDVNKKAYSNTLLLNAALTLPNRKGEAVIPDENGYFRIPKLTANNGNNSMAVYSFDFISETYSTGELNLYGKGRYALYIDNKFIKSIEKTDAKADSVAILSHPLTLTPGKKIIAVKAIILPKDSVEAQFKILYLKKGQKTEEALAEQKTLSKEKYLTLEYMMNGKFISSVETSPNGNYTLLRYMVKNKAKTDYYTQLRNQKGEILRDDNFLNDSHWLKHAPSTLYKIKTEGKRNMLVIQDIPEGKENVLVADLPEKSFVISPKMDALYYYKEEKGPKKDKKVIRHLDPDDRQPNWRNRSSIYKYDIGTGISTPVTFGYHSVSIMDIHDNGNKLLLGIYKRDWTKFPFYRTSIMEYTASNGAVDTLLSEQFGIDAAYYVPEADKILIFGSANAFNGIGKDLAKDMPANDYDKQMFLYNKQKKQAIPLTKHFNPAVQFGQFDYKNNSYVFLAENGSRKSLYRLDFKTNKISQIETKEDVVRNFSVSRINGSVWYIGQSTKNADRAYRIEKNKTHMVWDLSAEKLKGIKVSECKDWNYTSEDGTVIEGWYFLPPNFDPNKKYPLLVYYYGGTSPTQRTMEGAYSLPMFAAQGYVVYTLNPSGTTGYGQEFAARHLNAWGTRTASDIIEATKAFAANHSFVNAKKIGCFGASYGGFMTQYIQTRTDIFAAAISHAGISSISNYWGSGYWGIGYNSVAAYKSYPWNNPDLYVKHSPLFNADKIHTPLLLLHGSVDTNVPTAESVNMYNALKTLGRTVEFIEFTGQDHFILEHDRKISWTNTMFAWFAKWLQDNPKWWDDLYPSISL
ncbi:Prolyl tripeptidyl peptidase precursor [Porphyromonas macacae]|uniref:Prolyl tripeptidyl peptidase n=1 Tax=Porphyromonas macacae TaxID=28115 RepID=A0A379DIK5_9PORP|nr:prolyl oligopeptidase family serine peptidase [Porphyromonas macacae]SUB78199.1 Prolyl tripeptidyl peptidase precursor [Porphyromonas macacae]